MGLKGRRGKESRARLGGQGKKEVMQSELPVAFSVSNSLRGCANRAGSGSIALAKTTHADA